MRVISSIEQYVSSIWEVTMIDSLLNIHKLSLTEERYDWEVFDSTPVKLKIIELEKKRELVILSALENLKSKLQDIQSINYFVYSICEDNRRSIQIHRMNCICTESLKKGKFDESLTFDEAQKRASEILHQISCDIDDSCKECFPYWDTLALKKELDEFLNSN